MAKTVEGGRGAEAGRAGRRLALLRQDGLSRAEHGRGSARPLVRFRRLARAGDLALPRYQTGGAAGLDLVAAVDPGKGLAIKPGRSKLVPTGLAVEIPLGFEGQVRPRSGLALKHGLTVLNSPGTIDSDYRGEIGVLLVNLGSEKVRIGRGERIAQLVIAPVVQAEVVEVGALSASRRGSRGFGSTGTRSRAAAIGKANSTKRG